MSTGWSWPTRTPVNRFYTTIHSSAKLWNTILEALGISCRLWANSLWLPKSWGEGGRAKQGPNFITCCAPLSSLLEAFGTWPFCWGWMEDTGRHYQIHRTTGQEQCWDLWVQSVPQQPSRTKNEQFHHFNNVHVTTKGGKPLYCARSDWQPTKGKWGPSSLQVLLMAQSSGIGAYPLKGWMKKHGPWSF